MFDIAITRAQVIVASLCLLFEDPTSLSKGESSGWKVIDLFRLNVLKIRQKSSWCFNLRN